jgi:hypothetical protein
MVLQNKSDNSNRHALKWSNFCLNLSFWRCLSQKRTHFRKNENFRETKFRECSVSHHFRISRKCKQPFSFQP